MTGIDAPPRPVELEALAESIRTMVATINGRMEATAGPIAAIGDVSLEVTPAGDIIATVEGLDAEGRCARYSRFPLSASELLKGAVSLIRDAAGTEARRGWKVR